jgi:hypothetical protein
VPACESSAGLDDIPILIRQDYSGNLWSLRAHRKRWGPFWGATPVYPNARASVYPDAGASVYPNARASVYPDAGASVYPNARASVYPDAGASVYPDAGASIYLVPI